jgi:hypothetical protein
MLSESSLIKQLAIANWQLAISQINFPTRVVEAGHVLPDEELKFVHCFP